MWGCGRWLCGVGVRARLCVVAYNMVEPYFNLHVYVWGFMCGCGYLCLMCCVLRTGHVSLASTRHCGPGLFTDYRQLHEFAGFCWHCIHLLLFSALQEASERGWKETGIRQIHNDHRRCLVMHAHIPLINGHRITVLITTGKTGKLDEGF